MSLLPVIIPVKNEGENLIRVCESITRQCYKEYFEVVIVDNSDPEYEEYITKRINVMKSAEVNVELLHGE